MEITGANSNFFSVTRTSVSDMEERLVITYLPTKPGKHTANLLIDNRNNPELSKMLKLNAWAVDPNAKPTISVTPLTVPTFTAKVNEQVTYTLKVKSENCIDYVYASLTHTKGTGFMLSSTMFIKNMESNLIVTFRPNVAGEYTSTLTLSTLGGESMSINLVGTGTEGTIEIPDFETEFVWDQTHPYSLLEENFDEVPHNKTLVLEDWQNVVPKGNRSWWGYEHKVEDAVIERSAKATSYVYQHPNPTGERAEMWLVTPALDFKNAEGKVFTFRVMGDFMYEGHDTNLELYYIDATPGLDIYQQQIEVDFPTTPDLNGQWVDFHVDLTEQNIADVFFMAFRYEGLIGEENAVTYYIDDISWGRANLPTITTDSVQISLSAPLNTPTPSRTITVEGHNLTDSIRLQVLSVTKGNFSIYPEVLDPQGGLFAIVFDSDQLGLHEAYVKLSSRGAVDKYLPIKAYSVASTGLVDTTLMHIVYRMNGMLYVHLDAAADMVIYSLSGQTVMHHTLSAGLHAFSLPSGTYILTLANLSTKISV